jgi:hypothetical protein
MKYRDWEILDEIPKGWVIDKTAGAPAPKTVFITNGKSVISGLQKRALLNVNPKENNFKTYVPKIEHIVEVPQKVEDYIFPAKSVNNLARLKFKEHLLKEIMFDLMVCELEGWDKKEYIKELKSLIDSVLTKPMQKVKNYVSQQKLDF